VPDFTDTVTLYDELAYEDVVPVAWQPLDEPPDPLAIAAMEESNLHLLQACTAMDEQPAAVPRDKSDDGHPLAADLARLEFKLNLVLDMVAQLASREARRPAPTHVRFNSHGATCAAPNPVPAPGSIGVLHIHIRGALPRPLSMPARVSGLDAQGRVRVRFFPMSEALGDMLDKLAFRRHRRHVAEARRPR
jgi:hypothetical protein